MAFKITGLLIKVFGAAFLKKNGVWQHNKFLFFRYFVKIITNIQKILGVNSGAF